MEVSRVCVFRSLWGTGLEWTHHSKRPPFGLCQVRNQRKQRPPKQAAASPGTVLGEDWRPVPGLSDPGGLERLQGQGHGSSAAAPWAVPRNCLPYRSCSDWAALGMDRRSQARRNEVGGGSDLWVLGGVLLQCCCPFTLQRYAYL